MFIIILFYLSDLYASRRIQWQHGALHALMQELSTKDHTGLKYFSEWMQMTFKDDLCIKVR
jgi:hypothetical protein